MRGKNGELDLHFITVDLIQRQKPSIPERQAQKCSREAWGYASAAIVISFLLIFVVTLWHISQLDDAFCGCVACKVQNTTFCQGMLVNEHAFSFNTNF